MEGGGGRGSVPFPFTQFKSTLGVRPHTKACERTHALAQSVSLPSRSLTRAHACTPARTRCIDRLERRALGAPEAASLWLTPVFSLSCAVEYPGMA